MDPALLGTASAFGLAASAGLNTTLPLLIVGLLARFGLLTLAHPFSALSSDTALAGFLVLALVELLGDKVPGVDSAVQTAQWPLAAAAGAILFASQNSVITSVSPEVTILVGLLIAGGVHAARTAARPMITGLTFGLGNPLVSAIEDLTAVVLTVVAVFSPLVGLLLVVSIVAALGILAVWSVRQGVRASRALVARVRA